MEMIYDKTREFENEMLRNWFMTTASHELKKPLFTIATMIHMLLDRKRMKLDDKTLDDFLMRIRDRVDKALLDLNTLLQFHLFLSGSLQLDLGAIDFYSSIVEPVLKEYEYNLGRSGIVATIDMDKHLTMKCDPYLLKMVYGNWIILSNMLKQEQGFT